LPSIRPGTAEIRVGPGQLPAGRQDFEDLDGFFSGLVGLRSTAQPPQQGGEHAEVGSGAQVIAKLPPELKRRVQRPLGLFPPVEQGVLARETFLQGRLDRPVGFIGEP
jgi:hypothetical protein